MAYKFKYGIESSVVEAAELLLRQNEKAFRAEYSRMRTAAQHRIQRLSEEFAFSEAYKAHQKGFPKLKDIDKADLGKAYADLYKFMKAKTSTVTGQREKMQKTIATWNKNGADLNMQNYEQVFKIMKEMRKRKLVYDSEKVVALADQMQSLTGSQRRVWYNHLNELIPNIDKLEALPGAMEIKSLRGVSFAKIQEMLGG